MESEGFSNVGLFISVSSGYVLLAHGCKRNDDSTIEWNCSEDKGFHDVQKFAELYGFNAYGESIVSQDDNEPLTWADVFMIELEGTRSLLENSLYYDTKERCFYESCTPETYDEIMYSSEIDAFEQYTDRLPEWNEETQYLFQTTYLDKIKPLAEEWEARIMAVAERCDKSGEPFFCDETATEYYTHYFNRFWDRE